MKKLFFAALAALLAAPAAAGTVLFVGDLECAPIVDS